RGKALLPGQQAALTYLKGEAARQGRKYDQTRKLWEELAKGPDDLYRTRANLALTRLQVDQKKMNREDEINHLERLRYAWRGDELEAQINYWLGRAYFQQKQYAKGLNI